ncbi:type I secretion system permease/ATPase [uncultured Alsobacter sp.]|uniref:type I secretion system permease/ATPase n=1 Tax=uncultured Alsobacter sp. TaxID=1748258 RepID=UPI0025D8A27B|nr:type I secretion system permease/ATPase [uncultured Alsobacter sp.]
MSHASHKPIAETHSPVREALLGLKPAFLTLVGMSFFLNLLALTGPIYMYQVYDRVITSRNMNTLLALSLIAAILIAAQCLLDMLRSRALLRVGTAFDQALGDKLFQAVHKAMVKRVGGVVGPVQALRDLDQVRDCLTGSAIVAAIDLVWTPIFIGACFLVHPVLGLAYTLCIVGVVALSFANQRTAAPILLRGTAASMIATEYANAVFRNSEAIRALGMTRALQSRWKSRRDVGLGWTAQVNEQSGWFQFGMSLLKNLASTLGIGLVAFLVIHGDITAGALAAVCFLGARALGPASVIAQSWKTLNTAKAALARVEAVFREAGETPDRMALPKPKGALSFEGVVALPPNGRKPVLNDVSFSLEPGDVLGVIGPSAAGKSSLARVCVGLWPATKGAVRLDGAELSHWDEERLGEHIGYVPQDVELFGGTIAENIARFRAGSSEDVIAAARLARVHDMVQELPDGYNTDIGDGGLKLSGGQRQRIALARAVYGNPPLVVLDEPNASLDTQGEDALVQVIRQLKAAGSTVILVTHRSNILTHCDKLLVLAKGTVHTFGPRETVMQSFMPANVVPMAPAAMARKA